MDITREQRLEQALEDLIKAIKNYKVGQLREKLYKVENKTYINAERALISPEVVRGQVDLRTCNKGDILISALGAQLEYVRPTRDDEYLDHVVKYLEKDVGEGTRTHDGFVFAKNRMPNFDHDIVKIIQKKL